MQKAPPPVVRYHILCENVRYDRDRPGRISIDGLITSIQSLEVPKYPFLYEELCLLILLTEGRGSGRCHVRCLLEETGETVFRTADQPIQFGDDPLRVSGISFRIRDCRFPFSGRYSIEFCYNSEVISQQPLLLE